MTKNIVGVALFVLFGALVSTAVWAQSTPNTPPCAQASGVCPGSGNNAMGRGTGGGRHHGHGQQGRGGRGADLMTPEEHAAQQAKMREVKTVDECQKLQTEHRKLLEQRAKEKGVTLPAPRRDMCENMKARGLIK